tara:strand:- start:143 stop:523 length:381 start_codon:yes stop_codon:yes gene_type:complete
MIERLAVAIVVGGPGVGGGRMSPACSAAGRGAPTGCIADECMLPAVPGGARLRAGVSADMGIGVWPPCMWPGYGGRICCCGGLKRAGAPGAARPDGIRPSGNARKFAVSGGCIGVCGMPNWLPPGR